MYSCTCSVYDSAFTIFWLVCLMPLFPSWCFAKSQSLKFRRLLQQHRALIVVAEHQGKLCKAVCVCGLIRKGTKLFGWPCLSACFDPLFEQIEPRRHPGLEFVNYFYQHDGERDISSEGEEEAKRNASEGLQGQVVWVLHCSGRAFPNVDQQKRTIKNPWSAFNHIWCRPPATRPPPNGLGGGTGRSVSYIIYTIYIYIHSTYILYI